MNPNHNIPVGARTVLMGPAPLPPTPHIPTIALPSFAQPGAHYPQSGAYYPSRKSLVADPSSHVLIPAKAPTTPRTAPSPGMAYQTPPAHHGYPAQGYPSPVSPPRSSLPALQLFAVDSAIALSGAPRAPCNWNASTPPNQTLSHRALSVPASHPALTHATLSLNLGEGVRPMRVPVANRAGITVGDVLNAIAGALAQPIHAQTYSALAPAKQSRVAGYAQASRRPVSNVHLLERSTYLKGVCASASEERVLEVYFSL
ncbi:hypothetical protein AURDEDRAFT_111444 [Auricularia subglabra TFB-10046 SS5]|nr:hypothetical protein AURDEDRAFT_111444 [Auricularia subglabra TFB-10046 SS5]